MVSGSDTQVCCWKNCKKPLRFDINSLNKFMTQFNLDEVCVDADDTEIQEYLKSPENDPTNAFIENICDAAEIAVQNLLNVIEWAEIDCAIKEMCKFFAYRKNREKQFPNPVLDSDRLMRRIFERLRVRFKNHPNELADVLNFIDPEDIESGIRETNLAIMSASDATSKNT